MHEKHLEALYAFYNRRKWIHPDPLEFVLRYTNKHDQEIVGLIAASLAYGRVTQILRSIERVLAPMKPTPCDFLKHASRCALHRTYQGFKHRWSTENELVDILWGMKQVIEEYGSLEQGFRAGYRADAEDILLALAKFVTLLNSSPRGKKNSLLPSPSTGSACKRLHLYLRWMVRKDAVDPGCWKGLSPSQLLIPLDTHMHRIGLAFQFTNRQQASLLAVRDMTLAFKKIVPHDPVRYDFALTRLGIRPDTDLTRLVVARNALQHSLKNKMMQRVNPIPIEQTA